MVPIYNDTYVMLFFGLVKKMVANNIHTDDSTKVHFPLIIMLLRIKAIITINNSNINFIPKCIVIGLVDVHVH